MLPESFFRLLERSSGRASPAPPAVRNLAQFLRKPVCATPEEGVAAASVFISRSASPEAFATPRSPCAAFARRRHREVRAKENRLFYALSFEASFDVAARRCSPPHPRIRPAAAFAAISAAVAGKNFRPGC